MGGSDWVFPHQQLSYFASFERLSGLGDARKSKTNRAEVRSDLRYRSKTNENPERW